MQQRQWVVIAKYALVVTGLFFLAYGSVLGIEAALGVSSWQVLHIGLARHLPMTIGRSNQVVGVAVLAVAIALGVRPAIGTWLNMLLVGYFVDLVMMRGMVPKAASLEARIIYVFLGIIISSLGLAGYICAGLGAGPRDSLMLGVTRKTGWRFGPTRSTIEVSVVGAGYLLGGPVGVGTLLAALLTGPAVEKWMTMLAGLDRLPFLRDVIRIPAVVRLGRKEAAPGRAA